MNKTALKNFAINARRELIKKVEAKALKIGITEENIKKAQIESSDAIYIDGKQLSITEKKQRDKLIQRIKDIGFKQVVEEVAYTWFNRFIALRFMEVNNYLPTKVRVLSSSNPDSPEPDIIKEALSVDLDLDKEHVYELIVNNKTEELYKYLIIKQCNGLNKYLPFLFETIEDYKEILFPEGLLAKDSFLREMTDTEKIPESDWEKVEIIGWLYQYYIAEEKDRVIKAKKKYKKEEIPFATQLFTPDWIVRYMVQNTLGRYWVESHPEHRDLIKNWEFYLENPNQEPDFEEKLAPYINSELKVEDIKCFDPAMGSGHILVYMFDVLYEIYSRCGYMEREIPRLIIENNLYGLDIDDRAYQLSCFSVVMKALQYNNRFFRSIEKGLTLNLASIQETNRLNDNDIAYFTGGNNSAKFLEVKGFIEQFKDAKSIGSLVKLTHTDIQFIENRLNYIHEMPVEDVFQIDSRSKIIEIMPKLLKQVKILSEKYDVVITNPPYMGNKYMTPALADYLQEHYPDNRSDLFAVFMEFIMNCTNTDGHIGLVTPFVWMFIKTYEDLRKYIILNKTISSLVQLEYNSFETAAIPVCTFTMRNYYVNYPGEYVRLSDFPGPEVQPIKLLEAVKGNVTYRYTSYSKDNIDIPSNPIAYWITNNVRRIFKEGLPLSEIATPRQGIATADNERFLRLWYEVDFEKLGIGMENKEEAIESGRKWFPYNKGGEFRKWYGNNEWVVNWYNDGQEIKNFERAVVRNPNYYFKECITWSFISSTRFGVRYSPKGFIFDVGGSSLFVNDDKLNYLMGFLCSKLTFELIKVQNPTMNFQVGNVASLPIFLPSEREQYVKINELVQQNIKISKEDWDSKETSWDFIKHPYLQFRNGANTIEQASKNWNAVTVNRFNILKQNEEKLNEIYNSIYGLSDELSNDVEERDVTIYKADLLTDVKALISYYLGCMMGRYSLDQEGLVYAGGKFVSSKYKSFPVSKDAIIPILQDDLFENDVVTKFVEFVKISFGEEHLQENINFVAGVLGKKEGETSVETIRRYFLNDFYQDHISMYSTRGRKAPIYWLFTSGKQKAFNCLVYIHRYDKTTLSRIRTDYLHKFQNRLDAEKKSLISIIEGDGTAKEISNAKKELKQLDLKIEELKTYDELLHHLADMQIEIDLDDGVAVNYAKFNGLLAKLE
jgi:type II restriction/modification system DNA methylase subunit YeeA